MKLKAIYFLPLLAFLLLACSKKEQSVSLEKSSQKSITVYGACSMCESRIEKVALKQEGILKADWKANSLTVSYKEGADLKSLEKALAAVGHDTEHFKADDAVYNALPACCKYREI